jgi:hypothetical protein
MDFATGRNQVRWDPPIPTPDMVRDKRTLPGANGQQTSANSQSPPANPSYAQVADPRFDAGYSIAWYAKQPINPSDTLLGNRYLCRTGGMFIVAPSGLGKSTLSIQLAVLWCCGLVAFGISPAKALRILIIQSEDDQGDCTEMSQVIEHLNLTDQQKERVDANTLVIRCNNLVGQYFIAALRIQLEAARQEGNPFDLVIINPYGVYLDDDVKNTRACTQFLNEWLNPILAEFDIGAILIHHTPKTNFQNTNNYKAWDWMYWGAGCAAIPNWARAILVIKPETQDMQVYRFIAAKRGKRIDHWNNEFERYFAWSSISGVLRWEDATASQIAQATAAASRRKSVDLDLALRQVPLLDPALKTDVIEKIQIACQVGRDKANEALKKLIFEGQVFEVLINNPNPKARGFAGVTRTKPSP